MSRKNKIAISLQLSAFSLMILSSHFVYAENKIPGELPSKEPIVVNGDKVEYFQERKEVVGTGNISIIYRDVVLTCDKVKVYLDTHEAIAEGNVKVTQKGAYFTGERMNYNFDTKKGTVLSGYLNAKPFYGKSDEVDKIAGKDQFNLKRGYVTTCDLEKPHYRLQARQVRVYLDDKVVAKHILLFIGNTPVLYWPYYVQPLKERKSNWTVIPGRRKEWGYYVLTSYRYHITDKFWGDLLLDYRARRSMGLAAGANEYYDLGEMGNGSAKVYYAKEGGTNDDDDMHFGQIERRYRYQVRHYWDMGGDTDTKAILEFNKLSDPEIIKDYFYNEYTELGNNPDTYLTFITTKPAFTSELLFRKRFNKFQTVVERLPNYNMNINNTRLFEKIPLYYTGRASAAYLMRRLQATGTPQKPIDMIRIDTNNQLSYSMTLLRTLNITPYVGTEDTYYSRTLGGETNRIRTVFNAGIGSSVKFYRLFDVDTNFLGLDIHKLRHVVTPTANYAYTNEPAIGPQKLNQFDEIDAIDKQNHVTLGFENRLQTKRQSGGQLKSVDLATLLISSDYTFTLKKGNRAIYKQKFQNLDFMLELIPYPWLYSVSQMSFNTKTLAVTTASVDVVGSMGRDWSLCGRYDYVKEPTGISNLLTADAMYKLNDKWSFRAYERFNFFKSSFLEQEYTVYRDLHCFILEMTCNLRPRSDDYGIWLVFRLKAFPETPIGLRRTYSRPQFGKAVSRYQFLD